MEKYLSVPIPGDKDSPVELFNKIKTDFSFQNKNNDKFSIIAPYIIMTDGKEIIVYDNPDGELEIGLRCLVYKDDTNNVNVLDLLDSAIISSLPLYFSEMLTRRNLDKDSGKDLPFGTEYVLKENEISTHSSSRAIISLDKKLILPIYFLIFPNTKLVKLVPRQKDMPKFRTVYLNSIVKTGQAQFKLSLVSQSILVMISVGEITLPTIADSGDITRI